MPLRCLCYVHSVLSRGFSALPRVYPERVLPHTVVKRAGGTGRREDMNAIQKHRTSDWMGHFSPHSLPCQRRSEADQTQRAFAGKSQDGSPQATGRRVLRVQEGGTVQGANAAQRQPQLTSFQPVSELPPAQPDSVFSPIVIAVSSPNVILPHQHKLHTYGLLRLKGNN